MVAIVKSVEASEACSLERSTENLEKSMLDEYYLTDSPIKLIMFCISAHRMC